MPKEASQLVAPDDLLPGDVLLSRGMSEIAELICYFDGDHLGSSRYCHAAISMGGAGQRVIECVDRGCIERSLYQSIAGSDARAYVHIYRSRSNGRPRSLATGTQIAESAKYYKNERYGFERLTLAALVAQSQRSREKSAAEREAAHLFAITLSKMIDATIPETSSPRTCSSLVAQAYHDAGVPLTWSGPATPAQSTATAPTRPELGVPALHELESNPTELTLTSGSTYPHELVTPRDLSKANELCYMGKLDLSQLLNRKELSKREDYLRGLEPKTLLFVGAPEDSELHAIRTGLQRGTLGDRVSIKILTALTPEALTHGFLENNPDYVHIAATGMSELASASKQPSHYPPLNTPHSFEAIVTTACRAFSPTLLVLTRSSSGRIARQVAQICSTICTIGMEHTTDPAAAEKWTELFYRAFASGARVDEALAMVSPSETTDKIDTKAETPGPRLCTQLSNLDHVAIPVPISRLLSTDPTKAAALVLRLKNEFASLAHAAVGKGGVRRLATSWLSQHIPWWRLAALSGLLIASAAALGTGVSLRYGSPPPVEHTTSINPVISAQTGPSASTWPPGEHMPLIPGGTLNYRVTMQEARDAHRRCIGQTGDFAETFCNTFKGSYFERAALRAPVNMAISPFFLDAYEVTAGQVAAYLNRAESNISVVSNARELSKLSVDKPAAATNSAWLALVNLGKNPYHDAIVLHHDGDRFSPVEGHESRPARMVSWTLAAQYCEARGARLPTSFEWAWAARGGKPRARRRPWGTDRPSCKGVTYGRHAQLDCAAEPLPATSPVSSGSDFTPDGIFHLGGNVREWMAEPARSWDPDWRSVRGGFYGAPRAYLDPRLPLEGHVRGVYEEIGFRCARDAD